MKKQLHVLTALTLLSLVMLADPAIAQQPDAVNEPSQMEQSQVSEQATPMLTDAQKQEIGAIYKELFDKKKQLVGKYAEFGVITEEKAKMWSQRIDKHYARLEQRGFVPQWKHCDKKKD